MKTLIGLSIIGYIAYMGFEWNRLSKTSNIINNIKADQALEDFLKESKK